MSAQKRSRIRIVCRGSRKGTRVPIFKLRYFKNHSPKRHKILDVLIKYLKVSLVFFSAISEGGWCTPLGDLAWNDYIVMSNGAHDPRY